MESAASSDDDLAAFLAGLRQRYNLDAVTPADTSGADAEGVSQNTAAREPVEGPLASTGAPAISTDAAILGLHPAFGSSVTVAGTSLWSGQKTAAVPSIDPAAGTQPFRPEPSTSAQAGMQTPGAAGAAAGEPSPQAHSESGSCSPPAPASQVTPPADCLSGLSAEAGAGSAVAVLQGTPWHAAAAPTAAVGAVAAAATPHSTAAMPAARRQAQGNRSGATKADPAEHTQGQQAASVQGVETAAGAQDSSTAGGHQTAATSSEAVPATAQELAAGVASTGQMASATRHAENNPSSSPAPSESSSPRSVAKPLLAAFTEAAAAGEQHASQQQPRQQQGDEGCGSEVTLRSLPDSPGRRPQRQRQQQQQQQHAPLAGSPPRPLLGAWAARVAAASGAASPSQPHSPTAEQLTSTPADVVSAGGVGSFGGTATDPGLASTTCMASGLLAAGVAVTVPVPQGQAADVAPQPGANSNAVTEAQQQQQQQHPATGDAPGPVAAELLEGISVQQVVQELQAPLPQLPHQQLQQVEQQTQQQEQQEQQDQCAPHQVMSVSSPGVDVAWSNLSGRLSALGFGHLNLTLVAQQQESATAPAVGDGLLQAQQQDVVPDLPSLYDSFNKVLREYQQRDGLLQQLMSERDDMRRASRRSSSEAGKLERERDESAKAVMQLKAELANMRSVEIPALEAKHKEAQGKLSSEITRLKHALKEAETAAAAAQAVAAAASSQVSLQAQLQDAVRERERLRVDCERLESELSRNKPLIKELEKAAAAARAASRQSADEAVLLDKELRQLRQQHQEELTALTAELSKARHAARDAEQQLAAIKMEAATSISAEPELQRQLAAERARHEDQQMHLTSELHALRQQLLQLQAAAAKAEAAARADGNAAAQAEKELVLQEKQHKGEVAKLSSELRQARETLQLTQAQLLQVEAAAMEQSAAAKGADAAARHSAGQAAAAVAELEKLRSSSFQQQQQMSEQLQDSKRALAECQQQLASTQAELRRLRAAAALADVTAGGASLSSGPGIGPNGSSPDAFPDAEDAAGNGSSSGVGLSTEPLSSARTVLPGTHNTGDTSSGSGIKASRPGLGAPAASGATGAIGSDADLAAALSRAIAAEVALADAESSLVGLRYRCMQLEMSCSRKEQDLEALRERLAQKVTREERRLARDKAAYQRIKQAYAASGGAAARRGASSSSPWLAAVDVGPGTGAAAARRAAAGPVAAAARELRPVELVGIYEGQKEALEKELAAAKAEVRVLSGQLRDAQNLLISRDRAAAVAGAAAGGKGGARAGLGDVTATAAAQKKAAELQRELCTVRAEAASALREAAKRLAQCEAEVSQLHGDVNALQEELDSRPTVAEQRRLQREIDLLERKIATLRRQGAASQPGGAAAAGEDSLAVAAGETWGRDSSAGGSSRSRGTKTAIARDKALARLGLGVIEEFPRDVLVDVVQDACIALDLRDATLLVSSLKKVAAVAAAIPRVEAFVAQVCQVVLRDGLGFIPSAVQDTGLSPQCVPEVLQHWLVLLRQGELFAQLAEQLQQLVAQRCGNAAQLEQLSVLTEHIHFTSGDISTVQQVCQQLLLQVRSLLQVEAEAVAAGDVLQAAQGLLVSQPEGLLQRLVLQVMELLSVSQLEGLPAAVNRVYVHYCELLNFLRAIISLLALPTDAGPAAAMAALSKLVEQSARPPSKVRQAAAELQAAASHQQQERQQPHQQQQRPLGDFADDTSSAAARLSQLLSALGAADEGQAAERHTDMVNKLRRLDQVLPKYQSVVSQLYDRLRVVSLDDLLPAVDKLVTQQHAMGS